jgi:putative glycosyltransferase (TIGR04372 family)
MIIDRIFHKINSSKSHPYLYLSPHVYALGNCAVEIKTGLRRAKHRNKKLIILYPFDIPFIFKYKLTNRALFNLKSDIIVDQGKYFTLFSRTLMTIVYMPFRVVGLLLRKFSKFNLPDSYHFPSIGKQDICTTRNSINKFSFESLEDKWSEKFKQKIDLTISLDGNVCDAYEHQKIGIPKNSWFVCLHVRGTGFRGDKGRRNFRNPNILNYIPAIKEITSRGGWVVRMGDNTMTPLPCMQNLIDYPFTKHKSEFMDLCLLQNCRFFVGNPSGISEVAQLLHKDVLATNIYNWRLENGHQRDRGILMHVYSKKEERYLSIKELFTLDLRTKIDKTYGILSDDYTFIENSAEEISKAVLEYMNLLSNNNWSLTSKQKQYNEYRKRQGHRLLSEESNRDSSPRTYKKYEVMLEWYLFAIQLEESQGTLCSYFLEENW